MNNLDNRDEYLNDILDQGIEEFNKYNNNEEEVKVPYSNTGYTNEKINGINDNKVVYYKKNRLYTPNKYNTNMVNINEPYNEIQNNDLKNNIYTKNKYQVFSNNIKINSSNVINNDNINLINKSNLQPYIKGTIQKEPNSDIINYIQKDQAPIIQNQNSNIYKNYIINDKKILNPNSTSDDNHVIDPYIKEFNKSYSQSKLLGIDNIISKTGDLLYMDIVQNELPPTEKDECYNYKFVENEQIKKEQMLKQTKINQESLAEMKNELNTLQTKINIMESQISPKKEEKTEKVKINTTAVNTSTIKKVEKKVTMNDVWKTKYNSLNAEYTKLQLKLEDYIQNENENIRIMELADKREIENMQLEKVKSQFIDVANTLEKKYKEAKKISRCQRKLIERLSKEIKLLRDELRNQNVKYKSE